MIKVLLTILIIVQIAFGFLLFKRVYPAESVSITNEAGKPLAVLTVNYAGEPDGFKEGDLLVLKVLKIRGTKVDYGFCEIEREKN